MSVKIFFQTFGKSLLLALPGAIISFFVAFTIIIFFFSVQYSLLGDAIVQKAYLEQFDLILPFLKIYEQYGYKIIVIPIAVIIGLIFILSFVLTLKIINPNFSVKYIKNNQINRAQLFFALIVSFLVIAIIEWFLSLFSPLLASFLTIFLVLTFWHRQGIWGDLKKFNFQELFFLKKIIKFLLPTLFLTVWLYFIQQISAYLLDRNPYLFSFESPWFNQVSALFVFFNLCFVGRAIELPLYYLFSDLKLFSYKSLPKLIIPVILTIIPIVAIFNNDNFIKQYDFDKNFISETKVDQTLNDKKTIIILNQDKPTIVPVDYDPSLIYSSINFGGNFYHNIFTQNLTKLINPASIQTASQANSNTVSCQAENLQKVQDYGSILSKKDYRSFLSYSYFDYLNQCYKQNWQINDLYQTEYLALDKTNNILLSANLLSRWSLVAYKNQKLLDLISQFDATKYSIGKRSQQRLDEINNYYQSQSDQFFGNIQGKISMVGSSPQDIKVGLLTDDKTIGLPIRNSQQKLVAALTPDQSGNFRFYNILKGKYTLAVLVNQEISPEKNITINLDKQPTILEISASNKNINLGGIEIGVQ